MATRVLVCSKNPLTANVLAPVFKGLGIEPEVCADALSAIEKVTRHPFTCVIADWADQPEAAFLLKRARESAVNPNVVAVAVVDSEPAAVELREHRLDFLLYRPITVGEAAAVLAKACHTQQSAGPILQTEPDPEPQFQSPLEHFESDKRAPVPEDPNLVSVTAKVPKPTNVSAPAPELKKEEAPKEEKIIEDAGPNFEQFVPQRRRPAFSFRTAFAVIAAAAAAFCLWQARDALQYLARTPEGAFQVLRDSAAQYLFTSKSVPPPVARVAEDSQQDAYFVRPGDSAVRRPRLGVVSVESDVPELAVQLPKPYDFPLPTPEYDPPKPPPVHIRTAQVPDSIRRSPTIDPPVIATDPAHIMPVSAPPPRIPDFNEPVVLNEETARTMLVHNVEPSYPREAAAQKIQGPVVLQATIARDGTVEDLKIVRGYFVLSRAAIAAVKQWRFKPYMQNGRAAEVRTTITVNFGRPQG
jgi:TonB family protein